MAVSRSMVLVGVACVAALAILAIVWYFPQPANTVSIPNGNPPPDGTTVMVVDVDFIADYYTNNSSEVGYWEDTYCLNNTTYQRGQGNVCSSGTITTPDCPEETGCANVTPGEEFEYNLSIFNNGSGYHTVVTIGVEAPFSVLSVYPSLPVTMRPGLPAVTFHLTVLAPSSPGQYGLEGYVASY